MSKKPYVQKEKTDFKTTDFIEDGIKNIFDFITYERMNRGSLPIHVEGAVSAESAVPRGSDTDYRMRLIIDSGAKKITVRGPVSLPNDDDDTRNGAAYACKRIAEGLADLRLMHTIFEVQQKGQYGFEITDRR